MASNNSFDPDAFIKEHAIPDVRQATPFNPDTEITQENREAQKKADEPKTMGSQISRGIVRGVAGPAYGVEQLLGNLPDWVPGEGAIRRDLENPEIKEQAMGPSTSVPEMVSRLGTSALLATAMPGGAGLKFAEKFTDALLPVIGVQNFAKVAQALMKAEPMIVGAEKGAIGGGIQPTQSGDVQSHLAGAGAGAVAGGVGREIAKTPLAYRLPGLAALAAAYGGGLSGVHPYLASGAARAGLGGLAALASRYPGAVGAMAGQGVDEFTGQSTQPGSTP